MGLEFQFVPTSLSDIRSALNHFFTQFEDSSDYSRSTSSNGIILTSTDKAVPEFNELLELLTTIHPGRYFVANLGRTTGLTAAVTGHCISVSKSELICSEIIKLEVGKDSLGALPSVIRANSISGTAAELYVLDPETVAEALGVFRALGRVTYLDSAQFNGRLRVLRRLISGSESVVDLEWIRLADWREQIRNCFNLPYMQELLGSLERIQLRATGISVANDVSAFLLAGWLIYKLELTLEGVSNGSFLCSRRGHEPLTLELIEAESTSGPGLSSVEFVSKFGRCQIGYITQPAIVPDCEIVITLNSGCQHRHKVRMPELSRNACLERYFLIGESFDNYPPSCHLAFELIELKAGPSGA